MVKVEGKPLRQVNLSVFEAFSFLLDYGWRRGEPTHLNHHSTTITSPKTLQEPKKPINQSFLADWTLRLYIEGVDVAEQQHTKPQSTPWRIMPGYSAASSGDLR
ncbi:MAG: hypothetical protein NWE93_04950 [Candidatus Bathyarchaeota archaeon]|nr:hypothetical protein [Candidatus Bathyarchaeota archaeon]